MECLSYREHIMPSPERHVTGKKGVPPRSQGLTGRFNRPRSFPHHTSTALRTFHLAAGHAPRLRFLIPAPRAYAVLRRHTTPAEPSIGRASLTIRHD
jgi:hypothetical protein